MMLQHPLLFIIIILALIYGSWTYHELLILHNNDLRGRIEENIDENKNGYGGFARIAHVVKEAKRAAANGSGPPVLYLYAGDSYREPIWTSPFGSKLAVEFLNLLRPDVACLGDHNLNRPIDELRNFVKRTRFPLIVANIHFKNDSYLSHKIRPSIVLRLGDFGLVGVVGYVSSTDSYFLLSSSKRAASLFRFEDEVVAVRRECDDLRKRRRVDVIVALGYAGSAMDKRIAAEVADVDVVIGGLTNTLLWNGAAPNTEAVDGPYPIVVVQDDTGKRVPVVHTYGFAKYVGRLRLRFDDSLRLLNVEGNPIFLERRLPMDVGIVNALDSYRPKLRSIEDEDIVLGQCIVPMRRPSQFASESNLANFITDSLLEYGIVVKGLPATSMAIINAGSIGDAIHTSKRSPNITKRMINEAAPCYHKLVSVTILGTYIKQAIEDGVSKLDRTACIYGAGIRIDVNMNAPKDHRVKSVRVACIAGGEPRYCPLNDDNQYVFLTTANFLAQSGHDDLRNQGKVQEYNEEVIDALIYTFDTFGIIRPENDNRIFLMRRNVPKGSASTIPSPLFYFFITSTVYKIYVGTGSVLYFRWR